MGNTSAGLDLRSSFRTLQRIQDALDTRASQPPAPFTLTSILSHQGRRGFAVQTGYLGYT